MNVLVIIDESGPNLVIRDSEGQVVDLLIPFSSQLV